MEFHAGAEPVILNLSKLKNSSMMNVLRSVRKLLLLRLHLLLMPLHLMKKTTKNSIHLMIQIILYAIFLSFLFNYSFFLKQTAQQSTSNIRTYDATVVYDKFYNCAHLYLIGYDEVFLNFSLPVLNLSYRNINPLLRINFSKM